MPEAQTDLIDFIGSTARDVNELLTERMSQHKKMQLALEKIRDESFDPQSVDIATEALE